MQLLKIKSIKSIGIKPTIDLEVNHPDHNFYAEGMVTSNSHAVSYSVLSAQTIYLKFKYPQQFYLSLLKMTKNEPDPIGEISKIHKEMLALGVQLLPPSLTESDVDFTVQNGNIRFGLSSIKGISEKTMEKLKDFDRVQSDKFNLFISAKEAGIGIGVLSALIQAGTLDSISKNRVFLVYEAQLWNVLTDREKKYIMNYAKDYKNSIVNTVKALVETIKDEKSKPIIKASRLETIKRDTERFKAIFLQNSVSHAFANWWWENKLLGYTLGTTLMQIFKEKIDSLESISQIKTYPEKTKVDFIGIVEETGKFSKSKTGTPYCKIIVSDETGSMKVMVFGISEKQKKSGKTDYRDKLQECKDLNGGLPKEGDVVIIKGQKMDDDCVFADTIARQQNKIYTSFLELKDS